MPIEASQNAYPGLQSPPAAQPAHGTKATRVGPVQPPGLDRFGGDYHGCRWHDGHLYIGSLQEPDVIVYDLG